MIDPLGHDHAAHRAAIRAHVHAAEAECRLLYPLLATVDDWRGPAGRAFRQRVAALRGRIEAAHAALMAVGATL